jgi:hypothetical protein
MRQFARGSYLSRVTGIIRGPGNPTGGSLDFAFEMGDIVEVENEDSRRFKAEVVMADPFEQGVVVKIIKEII